MKTSSHTTCETQESKFRRLIDAATARYDAAANLEEQQAAKRELQALVSQQHAYLASR